MITTLWEQPVVLKHFRLIERCGFLTAHRRGCPCTMKCYPLWWRLYHPGWCLMWGPGFLSHCRPSQQRLGAKSAEWKRGAALFFFHYGCFHSSWIRGNSWKGAPWPLEETPKSRRAPEGICLWQTTSPMRGVDQMPNKNFGRRLAMHAPAFMVMRSDAAGERWCFKGCLHGCECFLAAAEERKNVCKTNSLYGYDTFSSQKVKHQKAAEWMALTDAVNPGRGVLAGRRGCLDVTRQLRAPDVLLNLNSWDHWQQIFRDVLRGTPPAKKTCAEAARESATLTTDRDNSFFI